MCISYLRMYHSNVLDQRHITTTSISRNVFIKNKMAEAAVQEQPQTKCYCHQCRKEIYPKLPDYICPTCSGGFIEDLSEVLGDAVEEGPHPTEDTNPYSTAAQRFTNLWGQQFLRNFMEHSGQDIHSNSSSSSSDGDDPPTGGNQGTGINVQFITPGRTISVSRLGGGTGHGIAGVGAENVGVNQLQSLLEPLLLGLTGHGRGGSIVFGGPGMGGGLHGNLGDYAWGAGGLDAIITQLMNQLEGSGPPPATEDKINSLPTLRIEDYHVTQNLQCNICFEDYVKNETVTQLPCQHLYHKDCITPWLRQHGTCPVCRKNMDGTDTSCDQNEQSIPDVLTNFGVRSSETQGGSSVRPTPGGSSNFGLGTDQNLANSEARRVEPSGFMDHVSLDEDEGGVDRDLIYDDEFE